MNKQNAIKKLQNLYDRSDKFLHEFAELGDDCFNKWYKDVELAIPHIFINDDKKHINDFYEISFIPGFDISSYTHDEVSSAENDGIESTRLLLLSFIKEISDFWPDDHEKLESESNSQCNLENICNKFHSISRQLLHRHAERETLQINDEYDVQDLMSAMLKIYFDDIRVEEYSPSYAGGSSRIDFLLDDCKIALEIKKTRKNLADKELGNELLIDIQRYKKHPNVKQLFCFIYDPEGIIRNPIGLQKRSRRSWNTFTHKNNH